MLPGSGTRGSLVFFTAVNAAYRDTRMTTHQDILRSSADRTATVTLNLPDKLNAWMAAMQPRFKRAPRFTGKQDD